MMERDVSGSEGKSVRKRIIRISGLLLAVLAFTFWLTLGLATPIQTVEDALEAVRAGRAGELALDQADAGKIAGFFQFAQTKQLGEPEVTLSEHFVSADERQVVARFLAIEYHPNRTVRQIYGGTLVFALHKSAFAAWRITQVEVSQQMGPHD